MLWAGLLAGCACGVRRAEHERRHQAVAACGGAAASHPRALRMMKMSIRSRAHRLQPHACATDSRCLLSCYTTFVLLIVFVAPLRRNVDVSVGSQAQQRCHGEVACAAAGRKSVRTRAHLSVSLTLCTVYAGTRHDAPVTRRRLLWHLTLRPRLRSQLSRSDVCSLPHERFLHRRAAPPASCLRHSPYRS